MKYGELTLGQVEAIVNKLGGMDGVRRLLAGEAERPKPRIDRTIELEINYDVAPADLLRATVCDYIYPWMLGHCPAAWVRTGKVKVKVELIDMGTDWTRDEALAAITELGLQVAPDNAALWTLSKDHPDLQREVWVVDPETVWSNENGNPCVAYMDGYSGRRRADLVKVARRWDRGYCVLALQQVIK